MAKVSKHDGVNSFLKLQERKSPKGQDIILWPCTANIFNVIFTAFTCVPFSNVIPLYGLHLITAPSTVKYVKTDLQWFTVISTLLHCNIYCKYL